MYANKCKINFVPEILHFDKYLVIVLSRDKFERSSFDERCSLYPLNLYSRSGFL